MNHLVKSLCAGAILVANSAAQATQQEPEILRHKQNELFPVVVAGHVSLSVAEMWLQCSPEGTVRAARFKINTNRDEQGILPDSVILSSSFAPMVHFTRGLSFSDHQLAAASDEQGILPDSVILSPSLPPMVHFTRGLSFSDHQLAAASAAKTSRAIADMQCRGLGLY